jgi:NAD(P)-dependent dehydrogenase (short-subunit alcohol dehydrogenase family)
MNDQSPAGKRRPVSWASELAGSAAFVTGGSSGIGRACALAFAAAGASVMVADVAERAGEETVAHIRQAGGVAAFVRCDVTAEDQVPAAVQACVSEFGPPRSAANCAGILDPHPARVGDYEVKGFDAVIAVNLRGVFLSLRYELAAMAGNGPGAIVNIASGAGFVGLPTMPAYTASKHGVIGVTKAAALDYAAAGIRVNAVCPGVIDTPMNDASPQELRDAVLALHPVGRIGRAEESQARCSGCARTERRSRRGSRYRSTADTWRRPSLSRPAPRSWRRGQ